MHFLKTASAIALVTALCAPGAALAQDAQRYEIAAQDLSAALKVFASVSGREVIASSDVIGRKRAHAAIGTLSAEAAIEQLLAGTGLRASIVDGSFVIRPIADNRDVTSDPDSIVVTGTRIRGAAPVGSPVVTIDRNTIDTSGRATVTEMVEAIPQNFAGGASESNVGTTIRGGAGYNLAFGSSINLRGLGNTSTLVLFDGVRPAMSGQSGQYVDTSLIPSTAIDRIELLTDGASAIYGTDAVAGVVNLRFREKFTGFETRIRAATADGDAGQYQLSQLIGHRWGSGGITAAVEFNRRDALAGASRSFVTEDLRPYGGPDLRSNFAIPGTIIAANGQIFGIPKGQDGTRLTAAQLIPGQQNRQDYAKLYDVLPRQQSWSGYLAADQDIAGGLSAFVRAVAAARTFDARTRSVNLTTPTVPVTNAFYVDPIGTRQSIRVQYDFSRDYGVETMHGTSRSVTVTGGLRGSLSGWNLELAGGYGWNSEYNGRAILNTARLAAALADSNPATAFNVFGDGSNTNPATLAKVIGSLVTTNEYENWSVAARADGTLFDLPAGKVKLAFGGEHRGEYFDQLGLLDRTATITRSKNTGTPGRRSVDSVYGELLVPVFAADSFLGQLDLSLAGRVDRYSDVGATENPKVGISWQPVSGVTARASYGTSFRAPSFMENPGMSNNLYQPISLADPTAPGGTRNVIVMVGSPDYVRPESAKSFTAGLDLRPRGIPGLTASATYFRIDYKDRISTPGDNILTYLIQRDIYAPLINAAPTAAQIAALYNDPLFRNPSGIAASSVTAILNAYQQNLASTTMTGIDFDLSYSRAIAGGKVSVSVSGTQLFGIDQKITSTAVSTDLSGKFGGPVKLRMRGHAGYASDGGFDASAFVNYTDGYSNLVGTTTQQVSPWTTVDIQFGIRLPVPRPAKSFRLSLSATNIFDTDPPYVLYQTLSSALAYDPEHAAAIGRVVALQAIIGW